MGTPTTEAFPPVFPHPLQPTSKSYSPALLVQLGSLDPTSHPSPSGPLLHEHSRPLGLRTGCALCPQLLCQLILWACAPPPPRPSSSQVTCWGAEGRRPGPACFNGSPRPLPRHRGSAWRPATRPPLPGSPDTFHGVTSCCSSSSHEQGQTSPSFTAVSLVLRAVCGTLEALGKVPRRVPLPMAAGAPRRPLPPSPPGSLSTFCHPRGSPPPTDKIQPLTPAHQTQEGPEDQRKKTGSGEAGQPHPRRHCPVK